MLTPAHARTRTHTHYGEQELKDGDASIAQWPGLEENTRLHPHKTIAGSAETSQITDSARQGLVKGGGEAVKRAQGNVAATGDEWCQRLESVYGDAQEVNDDHDRAHPAVAEGRGAQGAPARKEEEEGEEEEEESSLHFPRNTELVVASVQARQDASILRRFPPNSPPFLLPFLPSPFPSCLALSLPPFLSPSLSPSLPSCLPLCVLCLKQVRHTPC